MPLPPQPKPAAVPARKLRPVVAEPEHALAATERRTAAGLG
jgi:hypothetical protein